METPEQPVTSKAQRIVVCFFCLPISVYAGLLLNAAVSPGLQLSSALAIWMAIFVISIFLPAHLLAFAATYGLLRNRFPAWRACITILFSCVLVAAVIALSGSANPFPLVFSWATIPLFVIAYAIAAGREIPSKPKPPRG